MKKTDVAGLNIKRNRGGHAQAKVGKGEDERREGPVGGANQLYGNDNRPREVSCRRGRNIGVAGHGVFTLCGLLAALGWGGVTITLVIAARACTAKPPSEAVDASTSTDEVVPGSLSRPPKMAVLSFGDERTK